MALKLDQKIKLLASLPLLRALDADALHVLAFSARERSFATGETVFRQGDASDGGYLIVSGSIGLINGADDKSFSKGALIGESALISETQRPATAIVREDATVLVLPRSLMLQVLEAHPESAVKLRAHVARQVAETRAALRDLAV